MIKELHGWKYYIECDNLDQASAIYDLIRDDEYLDEKRFELTRMPDTKTWVVYSIDNVGTFIKTPKYGAWERIKRKAYKMKKESK